MVEVRWLCAGPLPGPVTSWFDSLPGRTRVGRRLDAYWMGAPAVEGTGSCVKLRGVADRRGPTRRRRLRLEVKVLAREAGGVRGATGVEGRAEVWCKAAARVAPPTAVRSAARSSWAAADGGWVPVDKHRRERRVAVGDGSSARLELTELTVGGHPAWSVALHARGPLGLRGVAEAIGGPAFAEWPAFLPLDGAVCRSYGEWLEAGPAAAGHRHRPAPQWLTETAGRLAAACDLTVGGVAGDGS